MLAVFGACGGRGDLLDIDPEDFGEPGQDGLPRSIWDSQDSDRPTRPASTA
jgi:hypothetical protein